MKANNISNRQLAFEIGTSESDIRRMLNAERNPGYLKLHKIATVLNITVAELISEFPKTF